MKCLKDNLWLWGQSPGSHHKEGHYKLPGVNRMTPAEGCDFFGIPNCCRVVMASSPRPPFDGESRQMAHLNQVVWSIIGSGGSVCNNTEQGDLDEVIRQARMFPNVTGAVLDDFLNPVRMELFPPEKVTELRNRLNAETGRDLDLWVVWYEHQLDAPVKPFLDVCDVITFWTWYGYNLSKLEENLDRMLAMTPGKRHLAGCYMWDYGQACPLNAELMEHQLNVYLKYFMAGKLEGIVFCSNCIADIGIPEVEQTRRWIAAHANASPGTQRKTAERPSQSARSATC